MPLAKPADHKLTNNTRRLSGRVLNFSFDFCNFVFHAQLPALDIGQHRISCGRMGNGIAELFFQSAVFIAQFIKVVF